MLCYKLIPHCPVRFRHAMIGGITAALAFEAAKHLFAIYVTQFPTQQAVYGAFATVPIFLLWVYLSWVIVLIGAQLTHSLAVAPGPRRVPRDDWRASDLYCAFRLLRQLHLAQHRGSALGNEELRRQEPLLDHAQVDELLHRLESANWVAQDNRFHWMLLRDLDDVTLGDLARIAPPDDSVLRVPVAALSAEDQRLRPPTSHRTSRCGASDEDPSLRHSRPGTGRVLSTVRARGSDATGPVGLGTQPARRARRGRGIRHGRRARRVRTLAGDWTAAG